MLSAALRTRRPIGEGSESAIRLGSHVKVLSGAFEGKIGVVQELDGKGFARVLLGLLVARLELSALILDRTHLRAGSLGSSHR